MLPLDTKFSGLTRIDLALKVAVPVPLMDRLEHARSRSAELGRPVAILLGDPPIRVHAHPQGTRGGYRYRCSANRGSETWKFRATRSPGWNCLLEFHNAGRRPLTSWELFLRFGRIRRALRLSPSMTRVSRLDCAAELVMPPGFSPDPTRFSAHARTRLRRQHHALSEAIHSDTPVSAVWRGRRVRALTVGHLPGREIEMFLIPDCREKSSTEQSRRDKREAAEVWRDETWRVEIRLGKKHLREVLKFAEFRSLGVRGDALFRRATSSIRYLADGSIGSNISRHPTHPFWTGLERAVLKSLSADKWV
jgi:hypothetical protein